MTIKIYDIWHLDIWLHGNQNEKSIAEIEKANTLALPLARSLFIVWRTFIKKQDMDLLLSPSLQVL